MRDNISGQERVVKFVNTEGMDPELLELMKQEVDRAIFYRQGYSPQEGINNCVPQGRTIARSI